MPISLPKSLLSRLRPGRTVEVPTLDDLAPDLFIAQLELAWADTNFAYFTPVDLEEPGWTAHNNAPDTYGWNSEDSYFEIKRAGVYRATLKVHSFTPDSGVDADLPYNVSLEANDGFPSYDMNQSEGILPLLLDGGFRVLPATTLTQVGWTDNADDFDPDGCGLVASLNKPQFSEQPEGVTAFITIERLADAPAQ